MKDLVRDLPLRIKVMLIFMVFLLVTSGVILLSKYYFKERERIKEAYDKAQKLDALAFRSLFYQDEFLLKESINPNFFQSDTSHLLKQFSNTISCLKSLLTDLEKDGLFSENFMSSVLDSLKLEVENLNVGFNSIVRVTKERGFKDDGVEGKMRDQAHELEDNYAHIVPPEQLLSLRRHEKDFINRHEEKYVGRFESEYRIMRKSLSKSVQHDERNAMILLDRYFFLFKELVALERQIGLNQQHGLKAEMEQTSIHFSRLVDEILVFAQAESQNLLRTFELYFIIGVSIFVLLIVILGVFFVRGLTHRLLFISESMGRFVQSNFTKPTLFPANIGDDEIGQLAKNFQVLEDEIVVHFANYRVKVEKRTMELLKQKSIIEKSKHTIEKRNQDILDSIKYAKRIQDSVLPSRRDMARLMKNYFVIYKPKDIVSGDFYWVDFRDGHLIVAVADCTGHGVPGAFMSILGHNFLNQAVNEHGMTDPGLILGYLNIGITSSLEKNRKDTLIRDGMDISIVSIHMETGRMIFSGAQRPIFILKKGELIELKGNRHPIGGFLESNIKYNESSVYLNQGDKVYLFSDGFADQFGGKLGKKLKYGSFRQEVFQLKDINSMYDQKRELEKRFDSWKGGYEQVDDVCVVGFEFIPDQPIINSFDKVAKVQIPALARQDKYQYPNV